MRILAGIIILALAGACATPAFADTIDWQTCYDQTNHHCMLYSAEESSAPQSTNPNELVTINLPQNGAPIIQGILSHDNFTALENNVAVMRVSFSGTNVPPTMNYCPQAKIILENQGMPEYLDKFYNTNSTPPLNLTHLVYPDYCYAETGANPVDGSYVKPVVTPEFPLSSLLAMILAMTSISVFGLYQRLKTK